MLVKSAVQFVWFELVTGVFTALLALEHWGYLACKNDGISCWWRCMRISTSGYVHATTDQFLSYMSGHMWCMQMTMERFLLEHFAWLFDALVSFERLRTAVVWNRSCRCSAFYARVVISMLHGWRLYFFGLVWCLYSAGHRILPLVNDLSVGNWLTHVTQEDGHSNDVCVACEYF